MFNYISGQLVAKTPAYAVIEANGIGYELKISLNTHAQIVLGKPCKLFCFLHVKEDAHTLYGFQSPDEKSLFLLLTSVSGVGPATALVMLSSLAVADIQQAILAEDVRTVQSVKGIGAKTAQRIILELKDKLAKLGLSPAVAETSGGQQVPASAVKNDAVDALMALGLPKATAEKSVGAVLKKKPDATVEDIIRMALRS